MSIIVISLKGSPSLLIKNLLSPSSIILQTDNIINFACQSYDPLESSRYHRSGNFRV